MRLNGIMRLRIVIAVAIALLSFAVWGTTLSDRYSAHRSAQIELLEAREIASRQAGANYFDQFDAKEEGPWEAYKNAPIAIDYYESSAAQRKSEVFSVLTIGLLWALLPVSIFWLLGSVVGWVYRGFKQSSEKS